MSDFKPMLSGKAPEDLETLRYPLLLSPKLDGIRCIIRGGVAVSRNLKPIPNAFVQRELIGLSDGVDGELMVEGTFNEVQSAIMSRDGEPDFTFHVFDWAVPSAQAGPLGFAGRFNSVCRIYHPRVKAVPHEWVLDPTGVQMREEHYVGLGYEGVMLRDPDGPYKFGRSTTKEGWLLKLKRFEDAEAEVVGVVERMHNENELEQDALGHAKRSHAKSGMVPAGDLGALVCKAPGFTETFEIGSGFTAQDRIDLWKLAQEGRVWPPVCFKYQPHGTKDRPRCPVFKGFRED